MAVLFADLVSYSLHVSRRQEETLAFVERCFALFAKNSTKYSGELVKTTGDGVVAVFQTATEGVNYAAEMLRELDRARPEGSDYSFRMGMHVGEVQRTGSDVYGHVVNVAARLEGQALPGSLCVSQEVVAAVDKTHGHVFETMGWRRLKNIPEQVLVYQLSERRSSAAPVRLLEIETIGGPRLVSLGTKDASLRSRAARALLGYLALSPSHTETVSRLAAFLRPEASLASGRRAAMRAAAQLGERLGDALVADGDVLRLDPVAVGVDVVRIEADVRSGRIDPVLGTGSWPARLLSGLEAAGGDYAAWLAVVRAEWRDRIASALEAELDRFEDVGDPRLRQTASALLAIETAHERAARLLIAHLHAAGNPGAATRVFDRLAAELKERYDIAPRAETKAAARGAPAPEVVGRAPSIDPLRVQVRRFEGPEGEVGERLASFRSEIIASLACFRSWSVVEGAQEPRSGSSKTDYALDARHVGDVGAQLAALTLTEAGSGRVLWSESFEIGSGLIEDARRRTVGRIAATLEVYLASDRAAAEPRAAAHDVVDEWLRAERLTSKWTPRSHDDAALAFEALIDRAPEFAPPHASLAGLLNVRHILRPGAPRDAEWARRAHRLADRAVELDPLDARNQLAVAWSAALDGAFDKASIHMDMAARLNPNSPRTLMSSAMGFGFLGERARAAALLAHSVECAPMLLDYQWCYAAAVHFLAGDDEAAISAAERGGDSIADNAGWAAAALSRAGRRAEAAAAADRLVDAISRLWRGEAPAGPDAVHRWFVKAYPLRRAEDRAALDAALGAAMGGGRRVTCSG